MHGDPPVGAAREPYIPPRERSVLRYLLDARAVDCASIDAVIFEDGQIWDYAALGAQVRGMAAKLQALGVEQGDHVLVWLPNGPDALTIWYAINYVGAIYVPINTAYKGSLLQHVIATSGARLALVHAGLYERIVDIDRAALETIVVFEGQGAPLPGIRMLRAEAIEPLDQILPLARPIEPWDTQAVIFTSGTTGPSKGVLVSYAQAHACARNVRYMTARDRHLQALPLFHAGGTIPCTTALMHGTTIILVGQFSTTDFWKIIKRHNVTSSGLLGVMAAFLAKQPPSTEERETTLRSVVSIPLTQDAIDLCRRARIDVYTLFNMTETSIPILSHANPEKVTACGKVRAGIDARIVDEHDCEVPPGQIGELILRSDAPWEISVGYLGNAQASADVWRNGWFHTGDAFRVDEEGDYYFVDRLKDSIRRRGENISSYEVELEVCAHPHIREAAAVSVTSADGEDDVLIAVSPAPGQFIVPEALIAFLQPRLAHFMMPRYIRILDDLPKTPTQKVMKHVLRADGVTPDSWDREANGIIIKREKLVPSREASA